MTIPLIPIIAGVAGATVAGKIVPGAKFACRCTLQGTSTMLGAVAGAATTVANKLSPTERNRRDLKRELRNEARRDWRDAARAAGWAPHYTDAEIESMWEDEQIRRRERPSHAPRHHGEFADDLPF